MLELTVPWEDHLEEAHERKRTNDELVVGLGITEITLLFTSVYISTVSFGFTKHNFVLLCMV